MMAAIGEAPLSEGNRSDTRRAGILFTFGSILFLLLTTAAEAVYPNFSMRDNAISDLAALGTSTTVIEEAAVLGLGLCWLAGAYLLFRGTGRNGLMVLNMLPGAGFLIAGISPENVNLTIHSIGTVAFPLGAIVAILSYRTIRSPFRYVSVLLGIVSLAATSVIFVGYRAAPCGECGYTEALSKLYLGLGGWESMIVYPLLLWLVGFGSYLMATPSGRFR